MAKLKKSVRAKSAASKPRTRKSNQDIQAKAEQMSRSLVESAQQIWMAGVGAFTRAQGEGSKLFEALVKEGMTIEQSTRKLATGKVDAVRDAVEDRVGVVRERAVDTWDRLESVFETRVQRALNRLGVPAREDLAELTTRVNELNAELRKLGKSAPAKATRKPASTKKAAAKKAPAKKTKAKKAKASKAPARKPASAKKPTARKAKSTRKPALPKAPKPVAPQAD